MIICKDCHKEYSMLDNIECPFCQVTNLLDENSKLKSKLHKRNVQIKRLKEIIPHSPKARIEKITLERLDDYDTCEIQDEGATKERIASFGQTWMYIGIRAKAEVSYEMQNVYPRGNRRIEWFTSGGLWGIESDSEEKYLIEVENEQLADLKEHLRIFNVDVTDFEKKINR